MLLFLLACGAPLDTAAPTAPPSGDSALDTSGDASPPEPGDWTDPIQRGAGLELEDAAELTDGAMAGPWLALSGQHQQAAGGLWIYDLTDPDAPTLAGQTEIWHLQRICWDGDHLWGMDRDGSLSKVSIADDGAPSIIDSAWRGSWGEGVACDGGRVAWGLGSLGGGYLLDEGAEPIPIEAEVRDALWDGEVLWTLAYSALRAWSPGTDGPTAMGEIALEGTCLDMAMGDGWIAAACGSGGVQLVSADPSAPAVLGAWSGYASARTVAVDGDRILASAWTDLIWIDAADPSAPALVASEPAETSVMASVPGADGRVYVADWGEPFAVQLADAEAPEVRPSTGSARAGEAVTLSNDGPVDLWLGEPSVGALTVGTSGATPARSRSGRCPTPSTPRRRSPPTTQTSGL